MVNNDEVKNQENNEEEDLFKKDQIIIVEPASVNFQSMGEHLSSNPDVAMYFLEEAGEIVQFVDQIASQGVPVLVLLSMTTKNDILKSVFLMKMVQKIIKKNLLKVIVSSAFNDNRLIESFNKLGCLEFLTGRISNNVLNFKISLQVRAMRAIKKQAMAEKELKKERTFKFTHDKNKSGQKVLKGDSNNYDNSLSVSDIERAGVIQLAEDTWIIRGEKPKKFGSRWVMDIEGPDDDSGQWVVHEGEGGKPKWMWKSNTAALSKSTPTEGWAFSGAKPVFNPSTGKWKFISDEPDLSYEKNGKKLATKYGLNAEGKPVVSEDSPQALKNIEDSKIEVQHKLLNKLKPDGKNNQIEEQDDAELKDVGVGHGKKENPFAKKAGNSEEKESISEWGLKDDSGTDLKDFSKNAWGSKGNFTDKQGWGTGKAKGAGFIRAEEDGKEPNPNKKEDGIDDFGSLINFNKSKNKKVDDDFEPNKSPWQKLNTPKTEEFNSKDLASKGKLHNDINDTFSLKKSKSFIADQDDEDNENPNETKNAKLKNGDDAASEWGSKGNFTDKQGWGNGKIKGAGFLRAEDEGGGSTKNNSKNNFESANASWGEKKNKKGENDAEGPGAWGSKGNFTDKQGWGNGKNKGGLFPKAEADVDGVPGESSKDKNLPWGKDLKQKSKNQTDEDSQSDEGVFNKKKSPFGKKSQNEVEVDEDSPCGKKITKESDRGGYEKKGSFEDDDPESHSAIHDDKDVDASSCYMPVGLSEEEKRAWADEKQKEKLARRERKHRKKEKEKHDTVRFGKTKNSDEQIKYIEFLPSHFGDPRGIWECVEDFGYMYITPDMRTKTDETIDEVKEFWSQASKSKEAPFFTLDDCVWLFDERYPPKYWERFEDLPLPCKEYLSNLLNQKMTEEEATKLHKEKIQEAIERTRKELSELSSSYREDPETGELRRSDEDKKKGFKEYLNKRKDQRKFNKWLQEKEDGTQESDTEPMGGDAGYKNAKLKSIGFSLSLSDRIARKHTLENLYQICVSEIQKVLKADNVVFFKKVKSEEWGFVTVYSSCPEYKTGKPAGENDKKAFFEVINNKVYKIDKNNGKSRFIKPLGLGQNNNNTGILMVEKHVEETSFLENDINFINDVSKDIGSVLALSNMKEKDGKQVV